MMRKTNHLPKALFGLTILLCGHCSFGQDGEYVGLPDIYISTVAAQDEDTVYVATPRDFGVTHGMIFKTTNGGMVWDTILVDASTIDLKKHPDNKMILYAGLGSIDPPFGILKTSDAGITWAHADSGVIANGGQFVQIIEFDPVHPETLYVSVSGFGGGDLYKTMNGGRNWLSIGTSGILAGVFSIAFDPQSTNIVYAGTGYAGLFKSTDGGDTWVQGGFPTGSGVFGIEVDPIDSDIVYASRGNPGSPFYRSTDAGVSWTESIAGLPENVAGGDLVINEETRELFLIVFPDSVGLFKSTDLGITWQRVTGLSSTIAAQAIDFSDDYQQLYLGITNDGVYRTSLVSDVLIHQNATTRPSVLETYPNPTNSSVIIQYEIFSADYLDLAMFDVQGREVAKLAEGPAYPGRYTVRFNSQFLSSGTYFCRLSFSSGEKRTSKVMLVR